MTDGEMREIAAAIYNTKGRFFGVGFQPRSGKPFRMMNAHDLKTSRRSLKRLMEDARAFLISVFDVNIYQREESSTRRIPLEGVRYFRCGNVMIDNRTEEQRALYPKVRGRD